MHRIILVLLSTLALIATARAQGSAYTSEHEGTFSIIARDPVTEKLGIGVHSKTVAVGSRTYGGKGGLAIFAHQASSNPYYSAIGIELLEAGMSPEQALEVLILGDKQSNRRQVAIIDIHGRTAAWTSPEINDWKGHKCGTDYCAQGNTLMGPEVVDAMAHSFENSFGPLAERLLNALNAAQTAGGDKRGMQSAALVVLQPLAGAGGYSDRVLDLRVDEHRLPLDELGRILKTFRSRELLVQVRRKVAERSLVEALELAYQARDLAPGGDSAWIQIAAIQLQMGQKKAALSSLRVAVDINSANRSQLLEDQTFSALHDDPDFIRILNE